MLLYCFNSATKQKAGNDLSIDSSKDLIQQVVKQIQHALFQFAVRQLWSFAVNMKHSARFMLMLENGNASL